MNIQEVDYKSKYFPPLLRDIASVPKKLYVRGQIPELPMITVVGTRKPSDYGRQQTYRIAHDLAKAGFCIVSGLAYGLDAVAHKAALDAKGKTIAVLGNSIDSIYPAGNQKLGEQILEQGGAIISEYEPGLATQKFNFPARNRILAGISLGVIITEADAKSGTLITANFALTNNRYVFAVPGNITSPRSAGPNNLIKHGAHAITDATDVLDLLGLQSGLLKKPTVKADSKEEAQILDILAEHSCSTAELIDTTGLEAAQVATILSLMEITGKIRSMGAGQWLAV
ncbi:DNA-protecting protein DprA [Candidatus Saccharibacteria bacterium]|nr:DNA-protecting protein DprA [Candidatus Saccharibacteria bacterium]